VFGPGLRGFVRAPFEVALTSSCCTLASKAWVVSGALVSSRRNVRLSRQSLAAVHIIPPAKPSPLMAVASLEALAILRGTAARENLARRVAHAGKNR